MLKKCSDRWSDKCPPPNQMAKQMVSQMVRQYPPKTMGQGKWLYKCPPSLMYSVYQMMMMMMMMIR